MGVDGSLAVLVDGGRVDRYEGGRLVGTESVPRSTPDRPLTIWTDLAPDNCAALSVGGDVVRLVDRGCFQGRAPRTFAGVYADWSPDGEWIAVAEPDAIVFHCVVGREASVRWNVPRGSSPRSAVDGECAGQGPPVQAHSEYLPRRGALGARGQRVARRVAPLPGLACAGGRAVPRESSTTL